MEDVTNVKKKLLAIILDKSRTHHIHNNMEGKEKNRRVELYFFPKIKTIKSRRLAIFKVVAIILFFVISAYGANPVVPNIDISLSAPGEPKDLVSSLNVLIVLTLLVLAPSLLLDEFCSYYRGFFLSSSSYGNSADATKSDHGLSCNDINFFHHGACGAKGL